MTTVCTRCQKDTGATDANGMCMRCAYAHGEGSMFGEKPSTSPAEAAIYGGVRWCLKEDGQGGRCIQAAGHEPHACYFATFLRLDAIKASRPDHFAALHPENRAAWDSWEAAIYERGGYVPQGRAENTTYEQADDDYALERVRRFARPGESLVDAADRMEAAATHPPIVLTTPTYAARLTGVSVPSKTLEELRPLVQEAVRASEARGDTFRLEEVRASPEALRTWSGGGTDSAAGSYVASPAPIAGTPATMLGGAMVCFQRARMLLHAADPNGETGIIQDALLDFETEIGVLKAKAEVGDGPGKVG